MVIEEDFPDQRQGRLPDQGVVVVDELEAQVHAYEPESLQQLAEFQQLLITFDDFVETRRERIDATTLELPPLFWVVIWVGAAVNAVLIAFIYVKSLRLHLVMAGMLSLFIGLVMFTTADMDHPYQGSIAIEAGAIQRVLDQMEAFEPDRKRSARGSPLRQAERGVLPSENGPRYFGTSVLRYRFEGGPSSGMPRAQVATVSSTSTPSPTSSPSASRTHALTGRM